MHLQELKTAREELEDACITMVEVNPFCHTEARDRVIPAVFKCMCVCVCVCMYVCMYVCVHMYMCVRASVLEIYICMCVRVYMYACMHVWMYANMYVCSNYPSESPLVAFHSVMKSTALK